jgi:predicted transcriptional regulator
MHPNDPNSSATLSVRLPSRVKSDLGRLARATKRTRSYLAGEAIEAFVAREFEIVEGIERGLADMHAGRVVPHHQVVAEMRQIIKAAKGTTKDAK